MNITSIYWINNTTGQVGSTEKIVEKISPGQTARLITIEFQIPHQSRKDEIEYFTNKEQLLAAIKNLIP
jgi:hypothetical protein